MLKLRNANWPARVADPRTVGLEPDLGHVGVVDDFGDPVPRGIHPDDARNQEVQIGADSKETEHREVETGRIKGGERLGDEDEVDRRSGEGETDEAVRPFSDVVGHHGEQRQDHQRDEGEEGDDADLLRQLGDLF